MAWHGVAAALIAKMAWRHGGMAMAKISNNGVKGKWRNLPDASAWPRQPMAENKCNEMKRKKIMHRK
jgi:hypothetical protein